jgi:blue copper oxidase
MDEQRTTTRFSRRTLLTAGVASAGLVATGSWRLLASDVAVAAKPGGGGGGAAVRNPLYTPPTVAPSGSLTAAKTPVVLSPTHTSRTGMTYLSDKATATQDRNRIPGPTYQATSGTTAKITLVNDLEEDTTVHWHGMVIDETNDGQPLEVVPPGTTRTYEFPVVQRAAFNWYHPHPHHMVSPQVSMGLAGGFIIRDGTDAGTQGWLPGYDASAKRTYEIPLVIRDVQLDSRGNMQYKPSSNGYLGSVPLVNGTRDATLAVDRAWYRFRILIGAPARVFRLALGNGAPMRLIGNDGGLLATASDVTELMLGPAERIDVLVNLTGLARDQTVMLRDLAAGWDLLELRGTGNDGPAYTPPAAGSSLSKIEPLSGPGQPTRTFSFDGMSRINGLVHDLHRIDFTVPFNTIERWRFTTGGNAPHPVHIHGTHFQVVSRSKGRNTVFPWERGWKDTVLLQKGEIVDVLIRFGDERTRGQRYLMHCHQLEHEDSGMMMNFRVGS